MKRQMKLRKKLLAALVIGGVASAGALPTVVWAQSANATLQGTAPPGAQVVARNVATGQVRVTTASSHGRYTLIGLPPGTWQVNAGPGTTPKTIPLAVASTSTLDFGTTKSKTAPEKLATVQVTANALDLINNSTSQVGAIVTPHEIQTLPQQSRNFLAFADTVPGMIFTTNSNGTTSLQAGAQNSNAINVYIDGISQKSEVLGGGVAGQFSTQGNPFPQDAIGAYRVITSNYKAEYGQVSSAVVTAVTKMGTNQFHGSAFMDYTNSNHRAETPSEKRAGRKTPSQSKEYGITLGGPIIKDKAHFFISDSQKLFNTPITVVPGVNGVNNLLPPDVVAQFGPASLPFFENLFFGDADWEITDRDRLVARVQLRREKQLNNIGGVNASSAGITVKNDARYYSLEWDHNADNWRNKATLLYQHAFYRPTGIMETGIGQRYTFGPQNNALIVNTGAPDPRAFQNKGQKGPGFKDALTFPNVEWHGDHTIQVGVRYQDLTLQALDAGDQTALQLFNVCPLDSTDPTCPAGTGSVPYQAIYAVPAAGTDPFAHTKDKQYGFYVQDDWIVNEHLTFNLGVRWDEEKNLTYLNWVTPANVVAAINSQDKNPGAPAGQTYAQSLALGGINVNDFIANGHNRSPYKSAWQPRLGFSYDLNGDQKHVFFGGAGRSYDRNLYNFLQLEQTKIALAEPSIFFSSPGQPCLGNPCVPWDPALYNTVAGLQALTAPIPGAGEVDMMSNHLKQPYSDQFSIGMRNRFMGWNTSATIVRVLTHDGLAAWLGDRQPNGAFFQPNGNADFGNPIPGLGNLILWTNGIETRSTQILLYATKPYTQQSPWSMTIAYTHTEADGNRDVTQHYSFQVPTIYDYPFLISNAAPKDRLVVTGSVALPWNMMFSGILTLATPTPFNTNVCYVASYGRYANGGRCYPGGGIPEGDGKFLIGGKIFAYRDIDLALIKTFRLPHDTEFYLRLDLLNAFNWHNLTDLNFTGNGVFTNTAASYNPTGNILGYPRTLKFTGGFRF